MPRFIIDYDELYLPFTLSEDCYVERYDDQAGFDRNAVEISDEEVKAIDAFWKGYDDYRKLIRSIEDRHRS